MLKLLSAILALAILTQQTAKAKDYPGGVKDGDVAPAFLKAKIVPDVFDTAPPTFAPVTFPPDVTVELGTFVNNFVALQQPTVTWKADPSKLYTLIVYGPDFPVNDLAVGFVIWHVANIPGNDISQGTTLTIYLKAPTLPASGGPKRVVFFVFEQSGRIDTTITAVTGEVSFLNVKDYAAKNNLKIYAGNFARIREL